MTPNNALFLTRVTYVADKRQVIVEFSNKNEKKTIRRHFFPRAYFDIKGVPKKHFEELISLSDLKRLKLDFSDTVLTVFGATFNDLKKINNIFSHFFKKHHNLVEPERQFLIDSNWSYFDSFIFESNEPEKIESFSFPDVNLHYFSDSLEKTVSDLSSSNKSLSKELIEGITSSKILKVPLILSECDKNHSKIFIENILFASSVPILYLNEQTKINQKHFWGKAELDFSKVISIVCAKPFNNIGFESINCSCCIPASINSKNIISSSEVIVKFEREGFFFNSVSQKWAEEFHQKNDFKQSREQRKKEYFYNFFPVGPFSRNQEASILFADAKKLEKEKVAKIVATSSLKWTCIENESALSTIINSAKNNIDSISVLLENENKSAVASSGLFFQQVLSSKPAFLYLKQLKKELSFLLSEIPKTIVSSPEFRGSDIAFAVECISASVIEDVGKITSAHVSETNFSNILVDSEDIHLFLKGFSELYNIKIS